MSTGYGNSTTGTGVAAQIALVHPLSNPPGAGQTKPGGHQTLSLSQLSPLLSGFQIDCEVQDVNGAEIAGTVFTLTGVTGTTGTSPADAVYAGTITGGGSNAFRGFVFTVAGFTAPNNNGTFYCVASSGGSLTLTNVVATTETKAATATEETSQSLTYELLAGGSLDSNVVSVTADGFVQALNIGRAIVEVSYPVFNNTLGNTPNGWPLEKIYFEIAVQVVH